MYRQVMSRYVIPRQAMQIGTGPQAVGRVGPCLRSVGPLAFGATIGMFHRP